MSRTFSISMEPGLRRRAERFAKANDRKMSDTIRVALREFLDRNDSQANNDRQAEAGNGLAKDSTASATGH